MVKALKEKSIYILIAFFHFINSSSAFHAGEEGTFANISEHRRGL